jgi:hypothetical protein
METTLVCPACQAVHDDPADAALGVAVLCLDCELEERYREALERPTTIKAAA